MMVDGPLPTTPEGNSVLVGHVRGAAGYNVFDRLDQLAVGDHVVATSRGETYDFVVDRTEVLPEGDTSPTEPTAGAFISSGQIEPAASAHRQHVARRKRKGYFRMRACLRSRSSARTAGPNAACSRRS